MSRVFDLLGGPAVRFCLGVYQNLVMETKKALILTAAKAGDQTPDFYILYWPIFNRFLFHEG